MKIIISILLLCFSSIFSFGQELSRIDTTLKSINLGVIQVDSNLIQINQNVSKITDELVKEKPKPLTGQSIFEDREGLSAIHLLDGGTIRLNTADASIKMSYMDKISSRDFFYGLDVSGKTNDGIMSFISDGNISPGAKINSNFGFK